MKNSPSDLFYCVPILFFITAHVAAMDASARTINNDLTVYQLGLPGCTYEVALKSGSSAVTSSNGAVAFSEEGGAKADSLMFTTICRVGGAENYCETIWREGNLDTEESILRVEKIKFHNNINWRYPALVFSSNATAVAEPRPRALYFCFSHDGKTVEGRVTVGNQVRDRANQALQILRTIKIY